MRNRQQSNWIKFAPFRCLFPHGGVAGLQLITFEHSPMNANNGLRCETQTGSTGELVTMKRTGRETETTNSLTTGDVELPFDFRCWRPSQLNFWCYEWQLLLLGRRITIPINNSRKCMEKSEKEIPPERKTKPILTGLCNVPKSRSTFRCWVDNRRPLFLFHQVKKTKHFC